MIQHTSLNTPLPVSRRQAALKDCAPNFERMLSDHAHYVEALDAFPDAYFVEDTVLCLPKGVILMRPAGFARTVEILDKAGFNVMQINNTECAKIDGDISCVSLQF